jgi:hypothetical protein
LAHPNNALTAVAVNRANVSGFLFIRFFLVWCLLRGE